MFLERNIHSIFNIAFIAFALFTQNVFASDITSNMEQSAVKAGAELVSTFSGSSIYLSLKAKQIIDQKKFDITDESFNQKDFIQYITSIANSEFEVLKTIDVNGYIQKSVFVITDFETDRNKTICSTVKNSRYMECDIRRLHKFYKGQYEYRLHFNLLHEWIHQLQYAENQYIELPLNSTLEGKVLSHDREFKAVLFEPYILVKKYGFDDGIFKYASMMAGLKCKFQEYDKPISEQHEMTQIGRRCLSLSIPLFIKTKTITSNRSDIEQMMYEIAVNSLNNKKIGVNSLVDSLNGLNMKINNENITYEKLINETKILFKTDNE